MKNESLFITRRKKLVFKISSIHFDNIIKTISFDKIKEVVTFSDIVSDIFKIKIIKENLHVKFLRDKSFLHRLSKFEMTLVADNGEVEIEK